MQEIRTIKYRGKVTYKGRDAAHDYWLFVTPDSGSWEQFWGLVDRKTVGQFTRHKDKNGTEIYEGDIISTDIQWFDGGEYDYALAADKQRKKNRLVENMGIPLFYDGDFSIRPEDVEVVGNVYEDFELLETKS